MATEAFLQFPKASVGNIQPVGEVLDPLLKTAIQIADFALGIENVTTIGTATGGAGTGKAKLNELVIKKSVDRASGPLMQACAQGAHFPEAVLSVRKANATGKPGPAYLTYRFSMIFCTKVEWAGPGDEGPEESVTFAYGAVQVSYQQADPTTGVLQGTAVPTSWNQVTNTDKFPVAGA